jgi:hypothetical protein
MQVAVSCSRCDCAACFRWKFLVGDMQIVLHVSGGSSLLEVCRLCCVFEVAVPCWRYADCAVCLRWQFVVEVQILVCVSDAICC